MKRAAKEGSKTVQKKQKKTVNVLLTWEKSRISTQKDACMSRITEKKLKREKIMVDLCA